MLRYPKSVLNPSTLTRTDSDIRSWR